MRCNAVEAILLYRVQFWVQVHWIQNRACKPKVACTGHQPKNQLYSWKRNVAAFGSAKVHRAWRHGGESDLMSELRAELVRICARAL